MVLSLCSDNKL